MEGDLALAQQLGKVYIIHLLQAVQDTYSKRRRPPPFAAAAWPPPQWSSLENIAKLEHQILSNVRDNGNQNGNCYYNLGYRRVIWELWKGKWKLLQYNREYIGRIITAEPLGIHENGRANLALCGTASKPRGLQWPKARYEHPTHE